MVDIPQFVTIISDGDDEIASRRYNKLLRKTSGRYRVLSVQRNEMTIEKEGKVSSVSIECITL